MTADAAADEKTWSLMSRTDRWVSDDFHHPGEAGIRLLRRFL